MKTILITGINGYLGSNLARSLSTQYNIIGLEYSLKNLNRLTDCNYAIYSIEGGIPDMLFANHSIDIIIHTATFYGRQNEAVKDIVESNLFIPFELLNKAIDNKCKVFINTDTVLERFVSSYALTKRHFQEWLYFRRKEIKVINMQLEHFYGPGCSNSNFLMNMINRLKSNEVCIDLTKGEQKRDFIYIDDIISAFITILLKLEEHTDSYTTYQVCTNHFITIIELMNLLKHHTNSSSFLNFGALPYRENELMESTTNNSDLLSLGWEPQTSLNDGIIKTILHKSN